MMKRLGMLTLVLLLCAALVLPAFAVPRNGVYILDEMEHLQDATFRSLHQEAVRVSESLGLDIIVVFTYEQDLEVYGSQLSIGQVDDQILLLENDTDWAIVCQGRAEELLTAADREALWDAYEQESTYVSGVEAFYAEAEERFADRELPEIEEYSTDGDRVVDQAELLTEYERQELLELLDQISLQQRVDVVVVTTDTLEGKTPQAYADDFFDFNGYGMGADASGILLLVSMEDRDYWISTCGYGITAFTDAGIEYLADRFLPDLSGGDYAAAFRQFALDCDDLLNRARAGDPYDVDNAPKASFGFINRLMISLFIGFAVALIATLVMRSQLKSVRAQTGAGDYVKQGSLKITRKQDLFLYRNVTRREKPKSSSGGSSTHTSSSGRSHGGGGGKF